MSVWMTNHPNLLFNRCHNAGCLVRFLHWLLVGGPSGSPPRSRAPNGQPCSWWSLGTLRIGVQHAAFWIGDRQDGSSAAIFLSVPVVTRNDSILARVIRNSVHDFTTPLSLCPLSLSVAFHWKAQVHYQQSNQSISRGSR